MSYGMGFALQQAVFGVLSTDQEITALVGALLLLHHQLPCALFLQLVTHHYILHDRLAVAAWPHLVLHRAASLDATALASAGDGGHACHD